MMKRVFGALAAAAFLTVLILAQAPTTHASSAVHYVRGISVQSGWLCYGWSSGLYHCTQHWRYQNGQPVSLVPAFVPVAARVSSPNPLLSSVARTLGNIGSVTAGQPCRGGVVFSRQITQWTVPSGCYAGIYRPNPANYPLRPSYGYCNWWPEVLHTTLTGSTALHLPGHATPRAGAVVFFAGGVQGASREGHYAQVVVVAPGGYWVLVTEMNFTWRGGGFARVDYRYIHVGAGVSFRY